MRTAYIYGHDGFDPDVRLNIEDLYRRVGVRLIPTRTLEVISPLVVSLRAPEQQVAIRDIGRIDVWDYVGNDITSFLGAVAETSQVNLFTSSEARLQQLAVRVDLEKIKPHIQLPPVSVARWRTVPKPVVYDRVHIGNVKPFYVDGSDDHAGRVLQWARGGNLDLWGRGWENLAPSNKYHGPARLKHVSALYSEAARAVGSMYPYQRGITISGRFWQAPLSGCRVMTEAFYDDSFIPGVVSLDEFDAPGPTLLDRRELSEVAADFWSRHFERAAESLAHSFDRSQPRGRRIPLMNRLKGRVTVAAQCAKRVLA